MAIFVLQLGGGRDIDTIEGLKLVRYGDLPLEDVQALGAFPVMLPVGEIPVALQVGVVDGIIVEGRRDRDEVAAFLGEEVTSLNLETGEIGTLPGSDLPSDGADALTGTGGADTIALLGGADSYAGKGGADRILGNGGRDTLDGGGGADTLKGGSGADNLTGGKGSDRILGDNGDDTLKGGSGSDRIEGGRGDDRMLGGTGADIFRFGPAFGEDVIVDFDARDDREKIDLRDVGAISGFKDLKSNHMEKDGGDVRIEAGANEILLRDVALKALDSDDFIF